jgi:pSer/pThr/pTyr-binding forkhead associated (FHA) protein
MLLAGDFDDEQTINSRPSADRPPQMAGAEPVHTLLLLNEHGPATRIPLRDKLLLAGRSPPAALILPGAMVSRRHCQFERQGNDVFVTDLNSTNGTFVDNARVATTTVLSDGARIAIGGHNLRYYRSAMVEPGPQRLVIEIDERKKAAEVAEIIGSDYFRDLRERTRRLALRRSDKTGK